MNKLQPIFLDIIVPVNLPRERGKDFADIPMPAENYQNENVIRLRVNIQTGKVLNWKSEYGYYEFFAKVVDCGTYILYDADGNELDSLCRDYVPNKLIPEHDGYGDYIELTISKSGYITNWYKQPKLDDFHVDFDEINRIFEED